MDLDAPTSQSSKPWKIETGSVFYEFGPNARGDEIQGWREFAKAIFEADQVSRRIPFEGTCDSHNESHTRTAHNYLEL